MSWLSRLFRGGGEPKAAAAETPADPRSIRPYFDTPADILLAELGKDPPDPLIIGELRWRGDEVVPILVERLDDDEPTVVLAVMRLLADMNAHQAMSRLDELYETKWRRLDSGWFGVVERYHSTLRELGYRETAPKLRLKGQYLREEVRDLWTSVIQQKRETVSPAELQDFCREAVAAMPGHSFESKDVEARTWAMIGSLIFKSQNPEWLGGFEGTAPCPEARRCYEEANRRSPDEQWENWVRRFSER